MAAHFPLREHPVLPSQRTLGWLFHLGLWLKGLHSLIEVIGAGLLYVIPQQAITGWVMRLTWSELLEDPQDILANALRHAVQSFGSDARAFAAWYLFSHGLIKLVLVLAILTNRAWAYPVFIVSMVGFIAYQVHLMTIRTSVPIVAITLLDAVVLALAVQEYRHRRRSGRA